MGLHDTEEMLEAAKADAILMERQIADLQDRLDSIRALADDPDATLERDGEVGIYLDEIIPILDRPASGSRGVFLRDHDAHEIAAAIRAGQTEPMSEHGEDVVSRMERA